MAALRQGKGWEMVRWIGYSVAQRLPGRPLSVQLLFGATPTALLISEA